jgi:pyruvate formate lyase activating enzyme
MQIAGLQRCSMVDYPGKVAAVVFTPGCNMDCHYCHNRALLGRQAVEQHDLEAVLGFLTRRRRMLDGVVVTGGEPTLQPGLARFLRQVRDLGLAVKLDTNGTRPKVVQRLLESGLIDFLAMDLKAPFSRYGEICGVEVDAADLEETVELVLHSGIDHEFRTTFSPLLTAGDVMQMAGVVQGARRMVLQQYRAPAGGDRLQGRLQPITAHPAKLLRDVAQHVTRETVHCITRGL